jgi:hypothetical protein
MGRWECFISSFACVFGGGEIKDIDVCPDLEKAYIDMFLIFRYPNVWNIHVYTHNC